MPCLQPITLHEEELSTTRSAIDTIIAFINNDQQQHELFEAGAAISTIMAFIEKDKPRYSEISGKDNRSSNSSFLGRRQYSISLEEEKSRKCASEHVTEHATENSRPHLAHLILQPATAVS